MMQQRSKVQQGRTILGAVEYDDAKAKLVSRKSAQRALREAARHARALPSIFPALLS